MTVYKIETDVDAFSSLLPKDDAIVIFNPNKV